jgi:mRNA-degrading endonuclease RelE of RelBE toxin-antitoxin system
MSYSIELTIEAEKDIQRLKKSGDKKVLLKINQL